MKWNLGLQARPDRSTFAAFLILSCLGMFVIFRQAFWGGAILAPLDIGSTLFSKYKWIDPNSPPLPKNHYLIDMFDYDLPRSYLVHHALHSGEFPWWEPYTEGGRPLIAEPHFGISDPLRLVVYRALPFVPAYNGTRMLQSLLAGVSMFLLLRCLGFSQFTTILGALSFQFCPLQTAFYYVVPAHSLFYYPLLWVVLHKYSRSSIPMTLSLGGILCAAIIMAGTPQSHVYLVLFLGCFVLGYGLCQAKDFLTLLFLVVGVFVIGCTLAIPILLPQVELFILGNRKLPIGGVGKEMLTGVLSLAGVFPWFTGSFKTLDLGKLLHQTSAAYVIHIGTPATILSVIGLLAARRSLVATRPEFRMAALLVMTYIILICSTPLLSILYLRASALAVPGLVVLSAVGLECITLQTWPHTRRAVRLILMLLTIGVLVTHVFALAIYPHFKERLARIVLQRDANNPMMPSAPQLRRAQIERLPAEITFRNPESLMAFLGAWAILGCVGSSARRPNLFFGAVFALNLIPSVHFAYRGMPYCDIRQWRAFCQGGPEQQRTAAATANDLRLKEIVPSRLDYAFPGTIPYLYSVHTLDGYSSLSLVGRGQGGSAREANIIYASEARAEQGRLIILDTNQARYRWKNGQKREVTIVKETLNSIELQIAPGPAGELIRTDTYYPGWRIEMPTSLSLQRDTNGFFSCEIPQEATQLRLRYQPSHQRTSKIVSTSSAIGAVGLLIWGLVRRTNSYKRTG